MYRTFLNALQTMEFCIFYTKSFEIGFGVEKFSRWGKKKIFFCVFADSFKWIHSHIQ